MSLVRAILNSVRLNSERSTRVRTEKSIGTGNVFVFQSDASCLLIIKRGKFS